MWCVGYNSSTGCFIYKRLFQYLDSFSHPIHHASSLSSTKRPGNNDYSVYIKERTDIDDCPESLTDGRAECNRKIRKRYSTNGLHVEARGSTEILISSTCCTTLTRPLNRPSGNRNGQTGGYEHMRRVPIPDWNCVYEYRVQATLR